MTKKLTRIMLWCLPGFLFIQSCEKTPTQPKNQPPVISTLTANPSSLDWGGTSQLVVEASDPEGQSLTYSWTVTGGLFITGTTGDSVTWQAPDSSGSFVCTVTVSDGKDASSKNVTLTVSEHPILSLDKDSLSFGSTTTSLTFNIANTGTGVLDWSITTTTDDGGSWITSATPSQGSAVTNEIDQVTVEVDRSGLAGGTYQGWVKVTSDDGKDSVRVIMDVAMLAVDQDSLDFEPSINTREFNITNSGKGTLEWTITTITDDGRNWLSANPSQGTTTVETDLISVTVERTGLADGSYHGWVKLSSNGGKDSVRVHITVVNPKLTVNPLSLDFNTSTTTRTFNITNTGVGLLTWTVSETETWLSVNPTSGSTTTETDQVTVTVARSGLSEGTYTGQITVTSNGGDATVNITMQVVALPQLSVSPTYLDFGETLTELNFEITNSGSGTLTWTVSENETWLSVSPTSGSTTTEIDQIKVTVNRSYLAAGETKTGQINISSNGGTATVNVSVKRPTGTGNVVFSDDFSGSLSQWTKQYCDAWISNGEVHVKGNTSGYYGTLLHSFSSYVRPQYTVKMKLARVSTASSDSYYGLYTNVNDTGYPAIPYFWFTIWPGSSGVNWAVFAYLSAGTSSQWALLASDSKGYSSLIKTGANQWNEVSYTIESDKTLIVKIGGTTLYQTNEIQTIENTFGITITMDLKAIGIRTMYNFEVKADDVEVSKPGSLLTSLGTGDITSFMAPATEPNVTRPPLPANLSQLPTLEEVLRGIMEK